MREKVCIVTPDLIGPIKNGGIGTHAFYLAQEIADKNYDVTILFTSKCEYKNNAFWLKYYEKLNIKYIHVDDLKKPKYGINNDWFIIRSYIIYNYLKENNFKLIHFQDWHANGFHTIQAKKNANEFEDTLITVTMHSPTQWQNEGMQKWNRWPVPDVKLEWCERYCCKNCDLLISPSEHMFKWALDSGWELNENRKIIPYCYENQVKVKINRTPDLKHIIFFGRLETRKGLEIFCDAVLDAIQEKPNIISKISFVGKIAKCENISSNKYIKRKFENYGISYNIYSNFNSFEAMKYLNEQNAVVVIPSKLDNYPYTVIECIENKLSFITSNVGGIPEMANEKILFNPNSKSLCNKLLNLSNVTWKELEHKYSKEKSSEIWLKIHEESKNSLSTIKRSNLDLCYDMEIKQQIEIENPLVSVCIPYYNYGKYLSQLLESIEKSIYKNYEVILVNDGSTEAHSKAVFKDMKKKYNLSNWHFYEKDNTGIGHTRNFSVEKSKGDYIIFMDADNIATPNMIYDFLYGILKSGTDCLTCHFSAFKGDNSAGSKTKIEYKYIPIGSALEAGCIQNVFGDGNFIIKKKVFLEVGGFKEDRTTSWEDYDFLVRLNLLGYKQDVIPKSLFWYRVTEEGFSRNTQIYKNRQRVLKAYYDNSPPYFRFLLNSLTLPLHYRFNELHQMLCKRGKID